MSEQNKVLVRRIIDDHWNQKNPALAVELFAVNCSLHTPDGDMLGIRGAQQLCNVYAAAFPDFRITVEDAITEGDRVAVRYTFAGTHKGALGAAAASGNRVSVPGMVIFRVAGGKVAEGRFAWDIVSLEQQIGALPRAKREAAS